MVSGAAASAAHAASADGRCSSAYCVPRPKMMPDLPAMPYSTEIDDGYYSGPYTHVEVGFPSEQPEPWDDWRGYCEDTDRPTKTVYSYVPVGMVAALIEAHGGEA